MPVVGYGTWKKEGAKNDGETGRAVEAAIMSGYRHIDCAAYYDNEEEIGEAILRCLHDGVVRREDLFVVSKLWNDKHAYRDVRPAFFASIKKLKVTYLDLFLVHWPFTGVPGDTLTPSLAETWRAMEELQREGYARNIGVCNCSAKKLEALLADCTIPPAVNQVEVHPYWRSDRLIAWCRERGIHVTAYSPLGSPDSESFLRRKPGPRLLEDPTVKEVAARLGKTTGQVLVRWAVQHGTSVLPKSVNPARMRGNLDVFSWELPAEDFARLSALAHQAKMVDGSFFISPRGPYRTLEDFWDFSFLGEANPFEP